MRIPIKIKINENGRGLEEIAKGYLLIFPDRKETARLVDLTSRKLYTQRKIKNMHPDKYATVYHQVVYNLPDGIITSNSVANIYGTRGVKK
jgi:hypothetical protein